MVVQDVIARIRAMGHTVVVAGPATSDAINRIESAVGRTLPESYRSFLLTVGGLSIYDSTVSGVWGGDDIDGEFGTVMGDTAVLRSESGLPDGFLVIRVHEDGAYCLDFNRQRADGECPVVNFEAGAAQHGKPVAATFDEWFSEFAQGWLRSPA